jgi:hypothetical protein
MSALNTHSGVVVGLRFATTVVLVCNNQHVPTSYAHRIHDTPSSTTPASCSCNSSVAGRSGIAAGTLTAGCAWEACCIASDDDGADVGADAIATTNAR